MVEVRPEWAGKRAKCPNCQASTVIPPPGGTTPAPGLTPDTQPFPAAQASPAGQAAPTAARAVDLESLRTPEERSLRTACLVVTCILGLVLVVCTFGVILLYVGMFLLMNYFVLAVMLAHIRGNGVKVGPQQLPEVHASVLRAVATLGMTEAPEVYVTQAGGVLNAFATRWAYRRYVVIYSDLLEACGSQQEVDLIIGHEVGHLAMGHILWHWLTLGGFIVPFLHQAYSRACELTCDRCGWATSGDTQAAMRGLLILAAGGNCSRLANMNSFLQQGQQVRGFWQTVVGWCQTHPWVTRRVDAINQFAQGRAV
jgi:Zn-dependent protease with chaperone function